MLAGQRNSRGYFTGCLVRVKQADVNVKNAFIRSDNVGCYHSTQTIFSLTKISQETNIHIRRIDFCDPQGGKGPCDRYTGVIKSHVRRFLNEKHNVTTAAEFVEVINSNEGFRGVYAYEARLEKMAIRPSDPTYKNQTDQQFLPRIVWRPCASFLESC